jgi:hypothetical protein
MLTLEGVDVVNCVRCALDENPERLSRDTGKSGPWSRGLHGTRGVESSVKGGPKPGAIVPEIMPVRSRGTG